jgi:hypothetical protein
MVSSTNARVLVNYKEKWSVWILLIHSAGEMEILSRPIVLSKNLRRRYHAATGLQPQSPVNSPSHCTGHQPKSPVISHSHRSSATVTSHQPQSPVISHSHRSSATVTGHQPQPPVISHSHQSSATVTGHRPQSPVIAISRRSPPSSSVRL